MLKNKKVLLCVTGGIAVFKAAALTSKLFQEGAEVKVMMTESAQQFVTPLTFQTLARNAVYVDTFEEKDPEKIAHIDLADWADVILIAPATANIIGKVANGIADDMISTTILAATAPVLIAPAMNVHMYQHPAVVKNMRTVASFGYQFIEPGEGLLACGYVGKGRLAEPEEIIAGLHAFFTPKEQLFKNKRMLVTAGPTVEAVDPVRYFTNRSSGKMGYAIAETAAALGAEVTLISGPTSLLTPSNVTPIHVTSAQEMYEQVIRAYSHQDVVIKAAAVADYRPKHYSNDKVKKKPDGWSIELERTKDILAELGKQKQQQILVGFAAESTNIEEYALQKLEKKNLDLIVANSIVQEGAGFKSDTNIVTILHRNGKKKELPLLTKQEVAFEILKEVHSCLKENKQR
ncbi:bifunctional phosphopantothenoylcysteine decarboxylase/phosphopantothenate--cysteine ligase CoaBC [Bacillus taeanensis]|uniref:Coenzyme A biosynthesis bifunctional protein CoaBC n=1 Tax=Bacillus taeanensis TaxID=273032 RepID=A0A366XTM5_9BACI|nr:bifunctional phosphopantothenoylcysteine decarboxylase/phosphopantothenate--cysteine ligase CoaBC [Bacillus taeanensis]RBW67504.1 bifunctional phosphopantothenoylcysteine decarboxylase/phosphopantothenate--cysteine ligase CoaBC [Bacillus taeanensis]